LRLGAGAGVDVELRWIEGGSDGGRLLRGVGGALELPESEDDELELLAELEELEELEELVFLGVAKCNEGNEYANDEEDA